MGNNIERFFRILYKMAIPRNTRSLFFISIIVVAVWRCNLANEIETVPIEAAIEFADRWLATPKMFFGIMLPTNTSFRKSQIVQLATKISTVSCAHVL